MQRPSTSLGTNDVRKNEVGKVVDVLLTALEGETLIGEKV